MMSYVAGFAMYQAGQVYIAAISNALDANPQPVLA
jgi:hypothetical protein